MNLPRLRRLPMLTSKMRSNTPTAEQANALNRFVHTFRANDPHAFHAPVGDCEFNSPDSLESPQALQLISNTQLLPPIVSTLLLEPNPASSKEQKYLLTSLGYEVTTAANLSEAFGLLEAREFQLLISEVNLPDGDCIDFLPQLRSRFEEMAIVLFTEKATVEMARKAVCSGASDFIVSPCNMSELGIIVERNLIRQSLQHRVDMRRQIALENTNENLLEALLTALTMRDIETQGHSERVTAYTMELANSLGISDEQLYHIERGALLHDIGKIGIPDRILLKPSQLSEAEWIEMRHHPMIGYRMCENIGMLREASLIILHHHESWDGSGYPSGLYGIEIPLAARIFAVADAFDAMTSDRPYRAALSIWEACDEIKRCAGTQFDPEIVAVFLNIEADAWAKLRETVKKRSI